MITQNQLIYVKLENVQGTDPTPGTGDFLAVHNLSISPSIEYHSPQAGDHSLSPRAGVLGKKIMEVSFDHELQVNNSAPTIPPSDALLQACGYDDKENNTAVDGKYYPASVPGLKCVKVPFDTGTGTIAVGNAVVGTDSGASGICESIAITSGAWAANAAGWLYLSSIRRTPGAADQTTGTGLSDLTMGGTYTGSANTTFLVNCDLAAATDTFKWNQDGGSWTTGVAMTGTAQTLADGVTVTFGATTGHTLNNEWTITCNDTYENNELLTVSGTECTVNGTPIVPTCTIWGYQGDVLYKINGCVGNMSLQLTAGQPVIMSFNLSGEYAKPVDDTYPTTVTDDGGAPLIAMGGSFTFGSKTPCIESMSFSLNNVVSVPVCISATHAAGDVKITDRSPEVTWNPEMKTAAIEDPFTAMEALTPTAIGYTLSNGTVDVVLSLPYVEISNIAEGENNGILTWSLTGRPCRSANSAGDDEMSIRFMATP